MRVFTAEVQVDREVYDSYPKYLNKNSKLNKHFTEQEIEEMKGIINECCSKLEKYGFTRTQHEVR